MIRSPRVARMVLFIVQSYPREVNSLMLADTVEGLEPRQVHSYLHYWVKKGWLAKIRDRVSELVGVRYRPTDYLLSIWSTVREMAANLMRSGKMSRQSIVARAKEMYRERFGREMDRDHLYILQIFIDQALERSSPYIQIDAGRETLPGTVKTILERRYGYTVDEDRIRDILREMVAAGIIYIDRQHYKARLDRSLLKS